MKTIALSAAICLFFYGSALCAAPPEPRVEWLKRLPHPGEFFFGAEEAHAMPHPAACLKGPEKLSALPVDQPMDSARSIKGGAQAGINFAVRELVWGSILSVGPDPEYAAQAKSNLLLWARADAMKRFEPEQSSQWWPVYTMMPGLLTAYHRLDEMGDLNESEKETIHSWLARLIHHIRIGEELPKGTAGYKDYEQRINNQNVRRNLIAMLWAIDINNIELFNSAIRNGYIRFLMHINKDGSLYDANRGMWAMRYSSFSISSALFIAESARHQGVELYRLEYNGLSIHSAVKFFLDSYDNEALINNYAAEDIGMQGMPFRGHQEGWLVVFDGVMGFVGWIDLYIYRFPDTDNTRRLKVLRDEFVKRTGFNYLYDWSFGNVTCFYNTPN